MRKIYCLIIFLTFYIFSYLTYSRTCPDKFGIGAADSKSVANGYNLSGYTLPFHMIARSGVYNVATKNGSGYNIETTRTRMDMYFTISQRGSGSAFNILSVKTVQE